MKGDDQLPSCYSPQRRLAYIVQSVLAFSCDDAPTSVDTKPTSALLGISQKIQTAIDSVVELPNDRNTMDKLGVVSRVSYVNLTQELQYLDTELHRQ